MRVKTGGGEMLTTARRRAGFPFPFCVRSQHCGQGADVYETLFLREKNGCGRMRISVWGSEVLYVGIRSFVLLSFLLFVAACFGFSEHCFGIPSVGG